MVNLVIFSMLERFNGEAGHAVGGMKSLDTPVRADEPTNPETPAAVEQAKMVRLQSKIREKVVFLSRPEVREATDEFNRRDKNLVWNQNHWFQQECGVNVSLVDQDGRLDPRAFSVDVGGKISKDDLSAQQKKVSVLEGVFADALNPDVVDNVKMTPQAQRISQTRFALRREHRLRRYGISKGTPHADSLLRTIYEAERPYKETYHAERAVMHTLYDILQQHFIVVRSTKYGDYAEGVDTMILDKTTGELLCTLDEVRTSFHDRDRVHGSDSSLGGHDASSEEDTSEAFWREKQKLRQTKSDNMNGGRTITHGLSIVTDTRTGQRTLQRGPVHNVPVLCIGVEAMLLRSVTRSLSKQRNAKDEKELKRRGQMSCTREQQELFNTILQQIEEQIDELVTRPAHESGANREEYEKMRSNANKIRVSLTKMRDLGRSAIVR